MVVQARIARTGVQVYRNPDGSKRREWRPDAEVAASMASFKLLPFTLYHPPVMVTAENVTTYSRGAVGETIGRDGKWVTATIAVHAKDAVDALESGVTQISCGYDCDLEMKSGVTPEGEHYDCIQRNIVGNHVALVPDARAGAEAAVRMDAAVSDPDQPIINPHQDNIMNLEQALAALAAANTKIGELTVRADNAERNATTAKADAAKLEADRDAQKERADTADKARTDAINATPARVKALVQLEGAARRVLGKRCDAVEGRAPEVDLNKLNEREIKLAVIKHVTKADCALGPDGKPRLDEYIDARYDAALERASVSADTFRAAHDIVEAHRADASEGRSRRDAARAEMIKANTEAAIPVGANAGAK